MKIEKIKPIPKYIQKKIKLYDDKLKTAPFGRTRFYAYFTKNDGELVKVTVAVREYKKQWYCKPVVVHGVHSDRCFGKDIKFTYIAGYTVGWHEQGLSKYPDWYESDDWGWASDDSFDPYAPIVNRDYIVKYLKTAIKKEPRQMIQLIIKNVVLYNDKIEIHFNYTEAKRPDDEKHRAFSFYSFKKSVMIDQHKLGKPPIEIEYEVVLSI